MKNANGFSLVSLLMLFVVIGAVGAVGWYVYDAKRPVPSNNEIVTEKAVTIAAIGDIVCDPAKDSQPHADSCQHEKVFELVKAMAPNAILGLGDLQYENGALDKFETAFAKSWGTLSKIFYPAPGNHEYVTPDATGYYTYFKSYAPGDPTIAVDKGYYSFDIGGWHLISLNSNCSKIGGCGLDSEQLKWLEADLNTSRAKCTLAFWHHPRFTSGKYSDDKATKDLSESFWTILNSQKADVILNGHDHLYERFALQDGAGEAKDTGIRQFTVGTGGRSLYQKEKTEVNSDVVVDNKFGALKLKLFPSAYRWEFVDIDSQVLDSGYQACN